MPRKIYEGAGLTEAPVRLIAVEPVDFNASQKRMETILNLSPPLSEKELKSSRTMHDLLFGKTIIATRVYQKELFIEFEDGTRVFVDNIENNHDISIT
jgi:hypothetical protein